LLRQDDSTEVHNTQGQLIRKTSLDGREDISYTYSNGRLAAMADHFGRQLVFGYDAAGRLTTMTDPGGGLYQYSYDTFENLTSVTYPDGTLRQYHYNEVGNVTCGGVNQSVTNLLTGISENGQRFATFKYDCGKAISTEHAGGVDKYSFTYSGFSPVFNATEIDPLGTTRTYTHSQVLSYVVPTTTSQPAPSGTGTVSEVLTYDANGNVASRTDFNGNRTNFTYDLTRNLETQRKEGLTSAGANTPQTRTISTEWHPTFRLPTRIAQPLRLTTNTYDADGSQCGATGALCSRTVQATSDASGALGLSVTPTGSARTWTYTYNANGRVLTVDGPRIDLSDVTAYTYYADDDPDMDKRGNVATITNAAGHRIDITAYNAHGQPLTMVDANALTTTFTYDPRRRLRTRTVGSEQTTYDYDPNGLLSKVTLPDGSFLSYGYDAAHRLTSITDNQGNRIAYTLDNAANRTLEQVFDPANALAKTRSRIYNNLNRLFQEFGALSQTTEYGYDNQGNVTSVKDPLLRVTGNQYDPLNRLKQVTDPGTGVTQYGYNGLDALTQVTDPRSLATSYTVDGLGNLTRQASPDTGNTDNTYDEAGNLLTQTDAKGQRTTYTYDALNRVTLITFHDGSKQSYAYDQGTNGIGRLSSITETDAANQQTSLIQYTHTSQGRVNSETRTVGGVQYVLGYAYDVAGRLSGLTYPSGRTLAYSFDSLGRVSGINTTFNGQTQPVVSNVAYFPFGGAMSYTLGNGQVYSRSFDQDGRINTYSLGAKSIAIGYDVASRIEFISELGNAANINNYGYDDVDRLLSAVTPGTSYGYTYDLVGNRRSKTVGASTDTLDYSTSSNRIATLTPGTGPVRSFVFDANGSTTNDGVNTYAYDTRGRMVQATSVIGPTNYQINALGQRIRKSNSQSDTVFHYDTAGHLIAETSPTGAFKREYIYLGDIPVGVVQ
jgi:YD repeat-containing protein